MTETTVDDSAVSPGIVGGGAALLTFGVLAYTTVLRFDRVAVGVLVGALSGSGVVVLGIMFVLEDPILSVGVAVTLAMTEYVVLSRVLPRAGEEDEQTDDAEWSSDEWDH